MPIWLGAIMRRRRFICLTGALAVTPLVAYAQQSPQARRIGVLMPYSESDREGQANISAFRQGLRRLGWSDARNVRLDIRWAALDAETIKQSAKELVALQPEVLLAPSTPVTAALLEQTRTIPIIFINVGDPVGSGFVTSFRRPGGNATGFIPMEGSVAGKWLELLREVAPRVTRVAFLFNPAMAPNFEHFLTPLKAAAKSVGVEVIAAPVRDQSELEPVIAAQAREPDGGLILMPDSFNIAHSEKIALLTARHRLPTMSPFRFFAEQGALLSYGNDRRDNFRSAATYADLILKGEKPANLPVQAPAKYELVVNLKTAKTLGLDVPLQFQQRADKVIE